MKLSCSECQQQLGELINSEVTGATETHADARGHVGECNECRRDLALLRAARDELRTFPVVAVPSDLRERVRAQIAAAPSTPHANPLPARTNSAQRKNRNFAADSGRSRIGAFFRQPGNVVCAGGLALSALCVILLSGLERDPQFPSPPLEPSPQIEESSGRTTQPPESNRAASKKTPAAKTKAGTKSASPTPPRPGRPFPPSGSSLPDAASTTSPASSIPPAPSPGVSPPQAEKPGALNKASKPASSVLRPSPPPSLSAQSRAPSGTPAPELPTPRRENEAHGKSENSETDSAMRSRAESTAPSAAGQNSDTRQQTDGDAPAAPAASDSAARPMLSDAPSAAAKPGSPAGERAVMRAPGGIASEAASATAGDSEAFNAQQAKPKENALISRQVVARVTAPRDVRGGQLSVVLPEGVRFQDGTKARVLWRGAVKAGQNVEVRFNVQAAAGAHTIRVVFQEVINGEAQTLAQNSISVSGR